MDFLFTPLPASNFQMTDEQLILWQRNAIFECECDNFVNSRAEAVRRPQRRFADLEHSAIDSALERHGIRMITQRSGDNSNVSVVRVALVPRRVHSRATDATDAAYEPAVRRLRLAVANANDETENSPENFYQEAYNAAIREQGLGLQRNP